MPVTLPEHLARQAEQQPDQPALVLLDITAPEQHITYRELYDIALDGARWLAARGVQPGERIIIALSDLRDTITTFWGALFLGAVPAIIADPATFPDVAAQIESLAARTRAIDIRYVITYSDLMAQMDALLPADQCRALDVADRVQSVEGITLPPVPSDADAIAYIQFSSGTTGEPRGIPIRYRMLMPYIETHTVQMDYHPQDVLVSWLPLYHDFGLVANFLAPVYYGVLAVLIPNMQWVRSPRMLFQAIHKYRATRCHMPNFAYVHSSRSVRDSDLEGIDLSHLRILANGSEPARDAAHQMFLERFGPYGFREEALVVGYGMAETVLAVSVTPFDQRARVDYVDGHALPLEKRAIPIAPDHAAAQAIVSCGKLWPGYEMRLVNADGHDAAERHTGEILLRAPWLFDGYITEGETTRVLDADGWFHTGDVGYMADGELYVIGRIKDLIIVGGSNIHPSDIELIANGVEGVRNGRVVAFGVYDSRLGTEAPVLVAETRHLTPEQQRRVTLEIRRKVREKLGVVPGDVHLVKSGWIVRTTSGKIARNANRDKYIEETADRVSLLPDGDLETQIAAIWEEVLGVHPIGPHDNFFALGGTSLTAATLFVRVEESFGRRLPINALLDASTVAQFAEKLREGERESGRILFPLQPHGTRPPLFLVHTIGGHLLRYYHLVRYLPLDQPVYGLQEPGLDGESALPQSAEEMIARYTDVVRAQQPHGPYYLGGFCFGGGVAVEIARRLREQGEQVALVILIDPGVPRLMRPKTGQALKPQARGPIQFAQRAMSRVREVPASERPAFVWGAAGRLIERRVLNRAQPAQPLSDGDRADLDRVDMEDLINEKISDWNRHLWRDFLPEPYVGRAVHLLGALKNNQQVDGFIKVWEMIVPGVETVPFQARHGAILREPDVEAVARHIDALLAEVQANQATRLAIPGEPESV